MFTLEMKVGRLVETRVVGTLDAEQVRDLFSAMLALVPRLPPGGKVLSCTDLRAARPMPIDVAEQMGRILIGTATRLDREAVLLGGDRVVKMQIERLEQETRSPARRACYDEAQVLEWLRPSASAAELARARRFLTDGRPK